MSDLEAHRRGKIPLDDEEIEARLRDDPPPPPRDPKPRPHRDLDEIDDPTEGPPSLTAWHRQLDEENMRNA